jgi:hypothetical protein
VLLTAVVFTTRGVTPQFVRSSWFVMKYSPVAERFRMKDSANGDDARRLLLSPPLPLPLPPPPPPPPPPLSRPGRPADDAINAAAVLLLPLLLLLGPASPPLPLLGGPVPLLLPPPPLRSSPPLPLVLAHAPSVTVPVTCTNIVPSWTKERELGQGRSSSQEGKRTGGTRRKGWVLAGRWSRQEQLALHPGSKQPLQSATNNARTMPSSCAHHAQGLAVNGLDAPGRAAESCVHRRR